ncbi:conserved hypothetical protein [Gluconacetobacter diazotrophicus PA1 5]|uniref:hypothetical protein n=1 Tax=Gluconacetobacter diazotrophicus TaxID=33996 RepID=UPI000173D03D|nr:hypothetical protein [Gluconacetobacter diazotrophicus]ACI51010.1 conserved hypothetical protein [Gluconacetobacter diazotrophicus PA1 5]TWB08535.1 hypothetical protein FBZ86_10632 [Gluconacetobacter diazotrophicus]
MPSSISSSDPKSGAGPAAWRRFAVLFAATAAGVGAAVYLFVAIVDPWDMLPLSPRWHRVPISINARYTMPALAVSARFDSAMVGTSTGRLLQPAIMDAPFDARFANLAMSSASPWEQDRLLRLFLRHHAAPRFVLIDIDAAWCFAAPRNLSTGNRPAPDWMYVGSPWRGYADIMSLYAVQEAANQFMWLTGRKRQRFGTDGYTTFLPPDSRYDPRWVAAQFRKEIFDTSMARGPAAPPVSMPMLAGLVAAIPAGTTTILWFPPTDKERQGAPGSTVAATRAACRAAVTAIARAAPRTMVVDFDIPGPVTGTRDNFWDSIHYRQSVARLVMDDLAAIHSGRAIPPEHGRVLVPLH